MRELLQVRWNLIVKSADALTDASHYANAVSIGKLG